MRADSRVAVGWWQPHWTPERFPRTPSVEGRGAGSATGVIVVGVVVVVVVGVVAGMVVPWRMIALVWNSGCAGY